MKNKKSLYFQSAFILSLVLNGFLLGFILAGPHMHVGEPTMFHDPEERLYEAARRLSPEHKDAVIAVLDQHVAELRDHRNTAMDGFKKLKTTLTADTISMDELNDLFEKMGQWHQNRSTMMDSMLRDLLKVLPDDQERAMYFANALPDEPPFPMRGEKNRPSRDRMDEQAR